MPAPHIPVMPMDERREMDSVTDAHRVAWLQHGLLVLRQLHPIRPSICLHLHGDATVRHPIMGGARGHGGQLLLPEAASARRFFAGARDRRLFFYDHAMGEGRGPTLPSAAAWPFSGGGPPAASREPPRVHRHLTPHPTAPSTRIPLVCSISAQICNPWSGPRPSLSNRVLHGFCFLGKDRRNPWSLPTCARPLHDHIIAERKRRQKINQRFIELSTVIPGLKKELQEKLKALEDGGSGSNDRSIESWVLVKKPCSVVPGDDAGSPSWDSSGASPATNQLPEIEARFLNKNVMVRIHCEDGKGVVVRVLAELEELPLSIVHANVMEVHKCSHHCEVLDVSAPQRGPRRIATVALEKAEADGNIVALKNYLKT
uniref:BHLH domain-containing protein n=2 Tax=Zea mays TaxID=4577 RepID=A0A804Q5C9_MAIZE